MYNLLKGLSLVGGVDKTHEVIKFQSDIFIVELNWGDVSSSMEDDRPYPATPNRIPPGGVQG